MVFYLRDLRVCTIVNRNYSPGVQLPDGGLWGFPLKGLDQGVQQVDALLA